MPSETIKKIEAVEDDLTRTRQAHDLLAAYQADVDELLRIRREGIERLTTSGVMKATEIADELDISRQAVSKLVKSGPPPERTWLGTGELTITVGEKKEAPKEHGEPGAAVAKETLDAYNTLASLAREVGLDARFESAPPPGIIDLNRDNLVVVCGPRLSPMVSQILAGDKNLGFDKDSSGWFLHDRVEGRTYRSPRDSGERADYGYLGRLPRPDGNGTFLYIAGVHATGTLGVAHWITHHLADIYGEVGRRRFSTLIRATFDASGEVTSSERVSPVYGRSGGGA